MNDFDALLVQVAEEARSLGIPLAPKIDSHVQINIRAVTRFGRCVRRPDGSFSIELSARLLEAEAFACRIVLAHELLHTCRGCQNHQVRWKGYAARMQAAFGYPIGRTVSCGALGLSDERPVRYRLICTRCGAVIERMRLSPLIAHPERYRCRCGGTLKPADPTE